MTKGIPSFQMYQKEFTAYIRDPINQPRPNGVIAKRMDVYKEIVFNNLFESVSACFPVAQKVLGKRSWLRLTHDFLKEYSSNTPIFRKIPEEFLSYLDKRCTLEHSKLPPYLPSLCHYEWIELKVSTLNVSINLQRELNPTGNLLEHQIALTPTLQLLNYDYAVQKISGRHKPKKKVSTQLLVFRNTELIVKFVELNSMTYRLIVLLQQTGITGKQALTIISDEIGSQPLEIILQFGLEILEDLKNQGIIIGVYEMGR
jgi:hypothetical protein